MTEVLSPGIYPVPAGMVATVVTHLEMSGRPDLRPTPEGVPEVRPFSHISPSEYRALFSSVGAQDWLWFSRLQLSDRDLMAILDAPDVWLATMIVDNRPEALLELDFRQTGACELAFFGVSPVLLGTGAGRALMNAAIDQAWSHPINRFHVHTCTLDHPGALSFYRRSGFEPIRQEIEIAPDPRLTGLLPQDAGSHVPIFEPD